MNKEKTKMAGIVFGVFDGLHEGHKYFLSEALKLCNSLTLVLTLPETVFTLKGRTPVNGYEDREKAIRSWNPLIEIIPGDKKLGEWGVFRGRESHSVILGYDQQGIARELEKMNKLFTFIAAHHPDKYKSSLLSKKAI